MAKIELTPEQRAEMDRQRAANPAARGVYVEFTPEQREEYLKLARAVDAGREEDIAHVRAIEAAAREPGFSGDLRRAIRAARIPSQQLADRIGIPVTDFEDFRAGQHVLTSDVIDRLIDVLGLKLSVVVHSESD